MVDVATSKANYLPQLQGPFLPMLFQQLGMLILPFLMGCMPHTLQLSALGDLSQLN